MLRAWAIVVRFVAHSTRNIIQETGSAENIILTLNLQRWGTTFSLGASLGSAVPLPSARLHVRQVAALLIVVGAKTDHFGRAENRSRMGAAVVCAKVFFLILATNP